MVGESGAGKSLTGAAIIGLLEPPGRIAARRDPPGGQAHRQPAVRSDAAHPRAGDRRHLPGPADLAQSALYRRPATDGDDHHAPRREQRRGAPACHRAADVDRHPGAERRIDHYPHQFSGGMRQRVVIALALAAEPKLIIADEPTTALDVSIQAQIIALLKRLCREHHTAVMLVTHDMGVIAETADRVAVMYAGRIAEIGPVADVIHRPQHPYTVGLMGSIPAHRERGRAADADRRLDAAADGHPDGLCIPSALPARLRSLLARASGSHAGRQRQGPPAGCTTPAARGAPPESSLRPPMQCPPQDPDLRRRSQAGRCHRPRRRGREVLRRLAALAQPRAREEGPRDPARRRRRELRHQARRDAGAGRRVRLRQVDGGAPAGRPVHAHPRQGRVLRPRPARDHQQHRPARCGGACR